MVGINPEDVEKAIKIGAIGGVLAFIILLAAVIATGNTFGQRCAKVYPVKSPEWEACIERIRKGGEI